MQLTGEKSCIQFYIPVILHLSWHLQRWFYPFHRDIWSAARGCDNQRVEKPGKGFLVPDQSLGWSLLFQRLAGRRRCWSPLWFGTSSPGLYNFPAAVLTPRSALEGVVFSIFHCQRRCSWRIWKDEIWSRHNPGGSPEWWVISMGRGSVWHSHLYLVKCFPWSNKRIFGFLLAKPGSDFSCDVTLQELTHPAGLQFQGTHAEAGKVQSYFQSLGSCTVGSHSQEEVLDRECAVQKAQSVKLDTAMTSQASQQTDCKGRK